MKYMVFHRSGFDRARIMNATGLDFWIYSGEIGQATLKLTNGKSFIAVAFKIDGIPEEIRRILVQKHATGNKISYDEALKFFRTNPLLIMAHYISVKPYDERLQ